MRSSHRELGLLLWVNNYKTNELRVVWTCTELANDVEVTVTNIRSDGSESSLEKLFEATRGGFVFIASFRLRLPWSKKQTRGSFIYEA